MKSNAEFRGSRGDPESKPVDSRSNGLAGTLRGTVGEDMVLEFVGSGGLIRTLKIDEKESL